MCHKLDPQFFSRLQALSPEEVCRRSQCLHEEGSGAYIVPFLRWKYRVFPARGCIEPAAKGAREVNADLGLLLLFYLIQAKDLPLTGKWVSEFDLAGGSMFFRGPHRFRNDAVASRFGRDLEGFQTACLSIGGEPVSMGDRAFRFQVLPRIPAIAILWRADEEFEASAKLLMDPTIQDHLPLDVVFGMSLELHGAITGENLWR